MTVCGKPLGFWSIRARGPSSSSKQRETEREKRRRTQSTAYRWQDERGEGGGVAAVDGELNDDLGFDGSRTEARSTRAGGNRSTTTSMARLRRPSAWEKVSEVCAHDEVITRLRLVVGGWKWRGR
jgi:hypothetical protein